jgi:hypothetical protein
LLQKAWRSLRRPGAPSSRAAHRSMVEPSLPSPRRTKRSTTVQRAEQDRKLTKVSGSQVASGSSAQAHSGTAAGRSGVRSRLGAWTLPRHPQEIEPVRVNPLPLGAWLNSFLSVAQFSGSCRAAR